MKFSFVRAEFKALIFLAFPILCTQLLQVGMGTTDIAITGHFDTKVQAAVALGVAVWNPILLFTSGTLMSVAIFSAHFYGARQTNRIATVFHGGLCLALILTVIAVTLMWFSKPIFVFFKVEEELIMPAVFYLRALSIGVPALFLFNCFRSVCEGVARPVPVTIVAAIGFLVNAFLNYFLVNGYAPIGLKSYGIVGSGLGTGVTFWVMLVFIVLFYRADYQLRSLQLFSYRARIISRLREMMRVGLPNGAAIFAEVTIFSVSGLILGRFGEMIVSSHQIALNITSLVFMIPLSTSFALTALVGQQMGKKDYVAAVRIAKMGRLTCFGIMLCTGVFLYFSRFYLPMIFTNNSEIIALSAQLLIFSIIFQIPDGLQIAANGALRGMKDTKMPMVIGITSYWLIAMPLGYYLGVMRDMQAQGVWIGLIIGLFCSAVLLNLRLWRQFKRLLA